MKNRLPIMMRGFRYLIQLGFPVLFLPIVLASVTDANAMAVHSAATKTFLANVPAMSSYTEEWVQEQWRIVRFSSPIIPAWVSADHVRENNGRVTVIADRLNLRVGSSAKAQVLAVIDQGYQSDVLGKSNGFVKVYAPTWVLFALNKIQTDDKTGAPTLPKLSATNPSSDNPDVVAPKWQTASDTSDLIKPPTRQSEKSLVRPTEGPSAKSTDGSSPKLVQSADSEIATASGMPVQVGAVNAPAEKKQSSADTQLQLHRLAPGDSISLLVFGENDLSIEDVRIPQSGRVSFPLIGSVEVIDKTTKDVEDVIRSTLSQGYIRNPRLTVTINSYRPIFIKGAVESSGIVTYTEGLTVVKVIALSGGTKNSAKKDGVSISREGEIIQQGLSTDSEFPILSGDIVSVEEEFGIGEESAFYVYLHGEVSRPGEYQFRRGLTVEKAVVLAGGFTLRASRRKISVSRIVEGEEKPVKLKKVALYLPVEPGDIIDVGASWF